MSSEFLIPGTKIHFGDWDYGWESSATILSVTPKGRMYRIQIHGARKASTISVKDVHQGRYMTYKGFCPIKIIE